MPWVFNPFDSQPGKPTDWEAMGVQSARDEVLRSEISAQRDTAAAAKRDPLDDQLKTVNERRTNVRYQREAVKNQLDDFLAKDGADLFEQDSLTGKPIKNPDGTYMPKLGAEVEALRAKTQKKTGLIAGALSPSKQRGDPTDDALAAQRRLAEIEPVYRLKFEKFQRIQGELDRLKAADDDFENQLGEIAKQREARYTITPQDVASAVQSVNVERAMRGQRAVHPADVAGPRVDARSRLQPGVRALLDEVYPREAFTPLVDPATQEIAGQAVQPEAVSLKSRREAATRGLDPFGAEVVELANLRDRGVTHIGDRPIADALAERGGDEAVATVKTLETVKKLNARLAEIDRDLPNAGEKMKGRLERERAVVEKLWQQKQALIDAIPTGERIKNALGSFVSGVAEIGAGTLDAIAITANKLDQIVPAWLRSGDGAAPGQLETAQLAQALREYAQQVAPQDPRLAEEFWSTQVPQGIGSMLGFFGPAAVSKSKYVVPLVLGAAVGGSEGYRDAIEHGADEETAFTSFLLNAGVGTTEIVPVSRMLGRLGKATSGRLKRALIDAGVEGFEEAAQEFFQTTAGNAIAQSLYDQEREFFEGAGEAGAVGGISGVLMSLVASALPGKARRGGPDGPDGSDGTNAPPAPPQPVSPNQPQPKGGGSSEGQEMQGQGNEGAVTLPPAPPAASSRAPAATKPAEPEREVTLDDQAPKSFQFTNATGETTIVEATRESQAIAKLPADFGPVAKMTRVERPAEKVEGEKIDREWSAFSPESKSLGIPRAEMPQVKAEHRGALTQFLKGRDMLSEETEVRPSELKPTQAEFSPAKVQKAREFKGGDRAILISQDNHIIDGHHQWVAKLTDAPDEFMRVIRIDAPIRDVLAEMKEFPSVEQAPGSMPGPQPSQAGSAPNPRSGAEAGAAPAPIVSPGPKVSGPDSITPKTGAMPAAPAIVSPSTSSGLPPKAPAIPRGGNKPQTFISTVAKASGLKAKDKATRFLADFAPRLHKANAKAFADMEVHVLNQAEWNAHPRVGAQTPDSSAAYNPVENTLYLNSEKLRGNDGVDAVSAIVHEAGHFAEQFALGSALTQREWEKLSHEQRTAAWREYSEADYEGDAVALIQDRRARAEWAAMQFARVVRGETDAMPKTIAEKLQAFLEQVRELVRKWVGAKSLTTAELDSWILDKLGYALRREQDAAKQQPAVAVPTVEAKPGILPAANPPAAAANLRPAAFLRPSQVKRAVSDEMKKLGDELFGAPGDGFGKKFDPAKIDAANKFASLVVLEHPEIRSRAALAKFIQENFPKARPYSESIFRIMGGFVDLDESSSFAESYGVIDNPAPASENASSNERTGAGRGNLDAGERNAGTPEQRPQQPEAGGASPANSVPPATVEPAERGGPVAEPVAGQPGGERGGGTGSAPSGSGGRGVEQTPTPAAAEPTSRGDEPSPGERSGNRSAAQPRAERASLKPEDQNHRIAPDDVLVPGGDKTKARTNLAALKLLKQLEKENRNPTPEEKKLLAQYVGWGGLPQVFDEYKARYDEAWRKEWGKLHDELKSLLTKEEWAAAARSTINAHYTSRDVIEPMWDLARRLGFNGGTALETSAGIGHFLGLEPADLAANTKWRAVELDDVTGRMLQKLYPEAAVQVTGFQDARLPNHSVDLVIGNYPFAKDGPSDDRYPRLSLHNYFFARAMDTLKPGGLMVAITSNSTMDAAASRAAREWLAERADLVGAIRLPNTAFKKNAGTEVTTDIVILRKRGAGNFSGGQNWLNTQTIPTYNGQGEVPVNEYFARNPEMMLGRMSLEGTQYRGDEPALLPNPGQDLRADLEAAIAKLPADVMGAVRSAEPIAAEDTAEGEQASGKEGSVVVKEGKAYQIESGVLKATNWSDAKTAQAKSFVALRDHLKTLIATMGAEGASPGAIEAAQAELNRIYDRHVKKFGPLSGRAHAFLEDDPELPLVQALEDVRSVAKEVTVQSGKHKGEKRQVFEKDYRKATIFSKRTIFPRTEPTSADTIRDAVAQSLAYRNAIDVAYIAGLRGITEEQATTQLEAEPDIYRDPKTGTLETADAYLSGFVREKLKAAKQAAANDPAYEKNVAALEKNQPEWLPIESISYRLGSTWIPPNIIKSFLAEKLGVGADVMFVPQTGHWEVNPTSGWTNAANTTTHGTQRISGHKLVEQALNLKSPVIYDEIETADGTKREKNQNETLVAQQKQQELKDLFRAFVGERSDFHPELEQIYNDQFNGVRLRRYTGPAWEHYPNASTEVKLRQHQKDVTARILQDSTLLAHSVGTGKTYIMITAAMEMRRLGMAKKPMIVTQNATTLQFAASFKRLYPTARILVPTRKQREAANRKKLMSQIATGDYDTVIIPQSFLNQLPDDPERLKGFIQQEIDELEAARFAAAASGSKNSPRVKDLEKAKARLEDRLKKLADRKTDDTVTFEQLGVDALFVDEAHAYKKLEFTTQMENIKGLDRGASERGLGLYMKTRWIQEKNNGKNVVLATGTPVSNTIAEAWNMLRFTRPDLLEKYGVTKFDEFAGTFGDTVTNIEQTAGGTFKQVTRFAKYTNGPELIAMFHSAADVVLAEDINLPGLPALKNGQPTTVTVKQTPRLKEYIALLRERLDRFEKLSGREKREQSHIPLVTFTDAKKAALDLRLIDASMPDEPSNKLHTAIENIFRVYQESTPVKGAQLVFADLFQSPDGGFNLFHTIRDELVNRGVPPAQIAIIQDSKTDAQRERIFEGVKAGEIRVMLGSTEKMGVGVNVQDKLVALHNLDAPHRPMDMEQRRGRIVRQGNENAIVEILNYGVENTLDATLYQRLAIKQKFINQIMRGDITGRSFEDAADEVSMSFEEQMAAFSGNPLAMRKVALEGEVRRLEGLKQGHIRQLAQTRTKLAEAQRDLGTKENFLPKVEKAAKRVADLFGEKMSGEVDGKKYDERKPLAEALDKHLSQFAAEQKKGIGDRLNPRGNWEFPAGVVTVHGLPVQLTLTLYTDWKTGKLKEGVDPHFYWAALLEGGVKMSGQATTGTGLLSSLSHEAKSLQKRPEEVAADIQRIGRDITEMTGFLAQPFQQEDQLRQATAERDEVERQIAAPNTTLGTPPQRVGIDALPSETQDDIVEWLAENRSEIGDTADIRANLIGLADEPRLTVRDMPLAELEVSPERQTSAVAVASYAAKPSETAPPIVVDGNRLLEGGHRVAAAKHRGDRAIRVVDIGPLIRMDWDSWMRGGAKPLVLGTPPIKGTPAQEAILAKVNGTLEDNRGFGQRVRDYLDDLKDYVATELKQKLVDQFASIKRLERATFGQGAKLDASVSAYKAARLTKNLPSVMDYLMRHGTLEYKNGSFSMAGGKGLMQIFKPLIDAGTLRLWEGYATAFRADRLLQEGKETNFGRTLVNGAWTWDAATARSEIDELLALGQQYPDFESVRQEYVAFQKSILDVAEAAGLINADQRGTWEKSDYVPFYRITESLDGRGPRKRRGIADQRSGIRQLKGGAAPVAIMENIVRNVETMIDASFKNIAMQRVADLASGNTDMLVRIPYQAVPLKASIAEVLNELEKAGVDTSGLSTEEADEFVKFWRMRAPKGKDVVSVMVDGRPIYYRVKDAALLRSVQSMGPRVYSWWMNVLMAPKHGLTALVTLDPAFMAANTVRDSFSAWVIADTPIKPGLDSAIGFVKSLRNDPSKLAIMAAGGGSGHYNNLRGGAVRDYIRQLTPAQRKTFFESIIDTPKKLARVYADIGRATENANRIAIYDSAKKRGASDAEAAFQALDIMDFGLRGDSSLLNFFLDVVPFLNARVQGLYRLGRGLKENPARVATHGAIIMGATVALLAANWDDDRYWKLPEWERDIYYHFWIGDQHIRIPKPFEVGQIFSTVPERLFEFAGKTGDAKLLFDRMLAMLRDTFAMNPLPQTAKPIAERAMNLNTFTGRRIISRGDEFKQPEQQFNVMTSDTLREVAQAMPDSAPEWLRSPKTLEHFVRGYFGSLGMYALAGSDALVRVATDAPEKPAVAPGDWWVMKRFAPSSDLRETKYVGQFYDLHTEITGVVRQIKELQKTGQVEQAREIQRAHADLLRFAPRAEATYDALTAFRKQEQQIHGNRTLGPEEKRRRLAAITGRRNEVAQQAMQASPRRAAAIFNPFR